MSDRPAGGRPENDVYTVLVALATIITSGAVVFMVMRSQVLFGSWQPF